MDHQRLLRLIRSNRFGPLNRTLGMEIKSCPTNLIASRFEYFSRMGLSCNPFNNSKKNYEMVYLANMNHQDPLAKIGMDCPGVTQGLIFPVVMALALHSQSLRTLVAIRRLEFVATPVPASLIAERCSFCAGIWCAWVSQCIWLLQN